MNHNEIRNNITEHKNSYSLCSLELLDCYNALRSGIISKLCVTIFNSILYDKINVKKQNENLYASESKRIYNKKYLSPKLILQQIKPYKYNVEGKDINKDVGNISKYINQLHDNNIFYVWKMGHPQAYMFFLERDPGIWKEYNEKATIPPKTILKMANVSFDAVKAMEVILEKNNTPFSKKKINRSYANFLDELIKKMPPSCYALSPKLSEYKEFSTYIKDVKDALGEMDDFQDFEVDESFLLKLPQSFRTKYLIAITEYDNQHVNEIDLEEQQMNTTEKQTLESLLIPSNKNLVSDVITKEKKAVSKKRNLNAKKHSFAKELKPFENCNDMIRYYQAQFRQVHAQAYFDSFARERNHALKLMDLLIENDRGNDKKFLRSWIRYYAQKLSVGRSKSAENTSIKAFSKTIGEYQNIYLG